MEQAFDKNDRGAIEAALRDPDPENPIARAVAAAISEFAVRLAQHAEHNQRLPDELLLYRPETAFDDVVIRLTLQTLADETGHIVRIHWLPRGAGVGRI
jgi:hypothetical protein